MCVSKPCSVFWDTIYWESQTLQCAFWWRQSLKFSNLPSFPNRHVLLPYWLPRFVLVFLFFFYPPSSLKVLVAKANRTLTEFKWPHHGCSSWLVKVSLKYTKPLTSWGHLMNHDTREHRSIKCILNQITKIKPCYNQSSKWITNTEFIAYLCLTNLSLYLPFSGYNQRNP